MEIVIAFISFIIGYCAEKILDALLMNYREKRYQKKIRTNIHNMELNNIEENPNILLLASGKPYFCKNQIDVFLEDKSLYLAFPSEKKHLLMKSNGAFAEHDTTFKPLYLKGISSETFSDTLEKFRQEVADSFIHRANGKYFNGKKYGVLISDAFSRTCDSVEQPILSYRLFLTDYFTENVLSKTVRALLPATHTFSLDELNSDLNFARTSMGVSVIVILKSSNQIIMTRRAKSSSFAEGKEWVYVSATEGFTDTDFDPYTNKPRLDWCVKRGLLEELNINEFMYSDSDKNMCFFDTFFETNYIQDGIVCAVWLNKQIEYDAILENARKAKDIDLEISKLFLLDNRKESIQCFIKENAENMRAQTIFSLNSYCARLEFLSKE